MGVGISLEPLKEAIEIRRSRRKYDPTPIDPEIVDKLRELISRYSEEANARIELILDNGDAFGGLRKSYGLLTGVRHYYGLIADKRDVTSVERLGYYGELLHLDAVTMGLSGCWVGGSFDRKLCPFVFSEHEFLAVVVVIGNAVEEISGREKLIYKLVHRKTKSIEEMYVSDTDVPDWFMSAMRAVQKAPSAVNRQPIKFSFKDGKVTAWPEGRPEVLLDLDFGIAKCHFAIGAGKGTWNWGNHAEFVY